jgi:hypothetical protein
MLPISASPVTRSTGMSHWCLASLVNFIGLMEAERFLMALHYKYTKNFEAYSYINYL